MNRTKYGDNAKIPKTRLQQSVQGQGAVQGEATVELEIVQDHGVVQQGSLFYRTAQSESLGGKHINMIMLHQITASCLIKLYCSSFFQQA